MMGDPFKNLSRREFLGKTAGAPGTAYSGTAFTCKPENPNALALKEGTRVRTKPFPSWPQRAEDDEQNIPKSFRNHP